MHVMSFNESMLNTYVAGKLRRYQMDDKLVGVFIALAMDSSTKYCPHSQTASLPLWVIVKSVLLSSEAILCDLFCYGVQAPTFVNYLPLRSQVNG